MSKQWKARIKLVPGPDREETRPSPVLHFLDRELKFKVTDHI